MNPERTVRKEVTFLETLSGARFLTVTRPAGQPRGGWLYVHPFAEELNKSRRMVAEAAQALAESGWMIVQIDLAGCGDSEGEFGATGWQGWLDDISHGWNWLSAKCSGQLGIWSLRAGSLLVSDWLRQSETQPDLLLWQPVRTGKQHFGQFLRLVTANEMLTANSKGAAAKLRSEIESGREVEVAGYVLAPALVEGLNASRLELAQDYRSAVTIVEIVPENRPEPSPGINSLVGKLKDSNVSVSVASAVGPSFWQTVEIETAPSLTAATIDALGEVST